MNARCSMYVAPGCAGSPWLDLHLARQRGEGGNLKHEFAALLVSEFKALQAAVLTRNDADVERAESPESSIIRCDGKTQASK